MDSYKVADDGISMDTSSDSKLQHTKNITSVVNGRVCRICGGKAVGINFNVVTCLPCKAFFRRNGFKPLNQFKCPFSGTCVIEKNTRRQCTSCRIEKCFAMGMAKERIRTQKQNQQYRELVKQNQNEKLRKSQIQKQTRSNKHPNFHHKSPSPTSSIHRSHIDVLYNLFLETSKRIIPKDFIFEVDSDLTKSLNLYCIPISCLIAFVKQLPHFQCLPIDDRLTLLKNNTKIILPMLNCLLSLSFDIPLHIHDSDTCELNNKIAHSNALIARLISNDKKLLFLIILTLLFSPCLLTNVSLNDDGCVDNRLSNYLVQYAHDEYSYLLWYYIMEKSVDDEKHAASTYMDIMTTIVRFQNLNSDIYDIITCYARMDQLHLMIQSILHLT